MQQPSHAQMDDVQDAIDLAALVEAAVVIYPRLAEISGVSSCALDAIGEIAFDRHANESVARFRDNPAAFVQSGDMVDIGPMSASSFAVLISALDAVAEAGHALDQMLGKRA